MRRSIMSVILLLSTGCLHAQQLPELESVISFAGVSCAEELSEDDVENLMDYMEHPLCINVVPSKRLHESVLLTHYQAVSLSDYRSRHGDVLSFAELAAVDGFGEDFVRKLRPFVSLESQWLPGQSTGADRICHDVAIRTGVRTDAALPEYGLRYKLNAGDRLYCGLSFSRSSAADTFRPDALSGYIAWKFRTIPGRVIAGDFNARFGQGLAFWNGMSMSGLTSPSSFLKRASGLSMTSSFTGNYALHGLGVDFSVGAFRITSLLAVDRQGKGLSYIPAANVSWFGKNGSIAMTHYAEFRKEQVAMRIPDMKTAADMSFCIRGHDVFSEVSYDWVSRSAALLAGTVFRAGDALRLGAMLRYYPDRYSSARSAAARSLTRCSNEYALSFGGDFSCGQWIRLNGSQSASERKYSGNFCADAACFPVPKEGDMLCSVQMKFQSDCKIILSEAFRVDFRLSERFRTWGDRFRTELRTDLRMFGDKWTGTARFDVVQCGGWGLLCYTEGGYVPEDLSLYLRLGLFCIDDWNSRIYVYERSIPGSFSVPAYYGRGVWAAFSAGWKYARWGKIYARASLVSYPFMKQTKPGKAELKLQCTFAF